MKNLIHIMLAMFLLSSCIKKEQEQTNETQIMESLNQNDADDALNKINEAMKTDNSDELLYLKASALSMKAGVDIYALFPLLKVKIFDVAIAQWSENREFQKKADAQRLNIGLNSTDLQKQKDEDTSKPYKPLVAENINYYYYFYVAIAVGAYSKNCQVEVTASTSKDIWRKNALRTDYIQYIIDDQDICQQIQANRFNMETDLSVILPKLDEQIRQALVVEDRKQWLNRKKENNKNNNYVKLLGTFWTLIDMVPMVSKIPKISSSGFKSLEEAQAILSKIRENRPDKKDEFGQKARKQLMMISALKIVSHIKNAFDLDQVKAPMDFICKSNGSAAEELFASEKDAFYLLKTVEDPEIINKNKDLFSELRANYEEELEKEKDNPELREIRLKKLTDDISTLKQTSCDNN